MPYSEADDTRKVQTAVTYGAESDQPVFLPYAHDNFDRFMRGRTRDDFYCGVLLGGCGASCPRSGTWTRSVTSLTGPLCTATVRRSVRAVPITFTSGRPSRTG
ncbi:hypothetical protein SMICM304S_07270 [Streptomyces microflavus]